MKVVTQAVLAAVLLVGAAGELAPLERSYKILMLLPVSSKSHRNVFMPLAETLADRGHKIVMLSGLPPASKNPNIQEINHELPTMVSATTNMFELRKQSDGGLKAFEDVMQGLARELYKVPVVKQLYEKRKDFDLIILHHLFNEPAYPFVHEVPFITVAVPGMEPRQSAVLGNVLNPSYFPNFLEGFPFPMTQWQRVTNMLMHVYVGGFWWNWAIVPLVQKEISAQFPDLPPLLELERNQSLTLMNTHFSISTTVPLLPSQVEVGAMHCRPARPLPEFRMSSESCWVLWLCTVVGVLYVGKWTLSLLCCLLTYLREALGSRLWKRNLAAEYGGKWAAITGSTDGIGKEYARQLAQKGMNIILISRTPEKLKKVEEEIKKEFGVQTHTVAADFSHGRQIYDGIGEGLKGKDIGILVNNVGVGDKQVKFNEVPEEHVWSSVNVNVASVVAMTKIVLPQMLARKRGAIVNISSSAALHPLPLASVYSATKAFVTFFSRALEFEYRDSGITVQTVQPSFVTTNMTSFSEHLRKPGFLKPSAATYVSSALPTLGHAKVTTGIWQHTLQTFFVKQMNRELFMYLFYKFYLFINKEKTKKTK